MKRSVALVFFWFLINQGLMIAQASYNQTILYIDTMQTTTKYGLHGKLVAQEGKGKELSSILIEAAALMKTAKGCHLYIVGVDPSVPDDIWITEVWDSKEDHDNSLGAAGVRELIGKAIPLLHSNPEKGQEWTILGGTGIE